MPDPSAEARAESDGPESESGAAGTSGDVEAVDAEAVEPEPVDAGPGFMNRAARRARAQGVAPRRSSEAPGQFGRKGTVQGPRQWGNRRSG